MTLGSASFVLTADARALILAMDQSEKAVKRATTNIAQQMGVTEQSVTKAYQKIDAASTRSTVGFGNLAKGALGMAAAIGGVTVGIAALHDGLESTITSTLKAQQAQRSLTAAYGESAGPFKKFADELAASLGKTNTEVETGVARMAILQKQYGITSAEIQKLTKIALDLGAAFGDNAEAIRSVQAAIRGEPEALEKYGIALQVNAIQSSNLLTDAEKRNFNALDAVSQARIRYRIILAESAQFEGAAAQRTQEAAGQFDKATRATDELAKAIGSSLLPGLGRIASGWADATSALAGYIQASRQAELDAEQMGVPGALARQGLDPATGKPPVSGSSGPQGPLLGPSVADVKAIQDQIEAETRRHEDEQVAILVDGLKKAHDAREKDLDDQKGQAERAEKAALDSLDTQKKAALDAIHEQADAAAEASRTKIAQLHEEEQQQRDAVESEKQATLDGIDAARKAADDAAEEQIKRLQVQQAGEEKAAQDRHDFVIEELDANKRARDEARTQEDRQLQDGVEAVKRAEDARHQAVTRELDDEVKAANDAKDKRLKALDDEAKAIGARHAARLTQLEEENTQASRIHEATLRRLSEEGEAAQKAHDETTRRLADELDAATKAHDATVRGIEARGEEAQTVHEAALRRITEEGEAAQKAHDATLKALAEELDAGQHTHDVRLHELDGQLSKAQDVHEAALRGIQREADAEDERHRHALDNLDAERKTRQDAIDEQIAALDAVDKATQHAEQTQRLNDAVATAQSGVKKAESTGNQAEIDRANRELAAARKAITDNTAKNERDAARETLRVQKDALNDEIDARKDAEDETNRLTKARLDAEKQAADTELALVKRRIDSEKQAADDILALLRTNVEARKRAADEGLAQIQERLKAEQEAADADYARIQAILKAEREAADEKLRLIRERVDKEKQAADDQFKLTQERLAKEKQAADDLLKLTTDRLAKEKDQADAALAQAKDRLDKRKLAVDDANKHELEGIAERKRQEQDQHDAAVQQAQDAATARKRAIDDVRTKENEADADQRKQADRARDDEIARIKAIYTDPFTGLIPNIQRAKEAADLSFAAQRTAAERAAQAQIDAINATYNDPIRGLIPLAQAAERAVAKSFQDQAAHVTASFEAQRAAVQAAYRAPDGKSGILDQIDESKRLLDEQLKAEEERWKDYQKGLTGKDGTITKTWEEALKAAQAYFDEVDRRRKAQAGAGSGSAPGSGSSPGSGSNPGASPGGSNPGARPGQPGGPLGPAVPGGPSTGPGGPGAPNKTDLTPAAQLMPQEVTSWLQAAMRLTNDDGQELAGLINLAAQESSGNPRAVNPTEVRDPRTGANLGHATGLLQTLPGTFSSNALPGHTNILDPVDNAAAAIRYIQHHPNYGGSVYGTPYYSQGFFSAAGVSGYKDGGWINEPTLLVGANKGPYAIAGEAGRPEWVGPVAAGGAGSADVYLDLRGAHVYDGVKFEDHVVSALRTAGFGNRLRDIIRRYG